MFTNTHDFYIYILGSMYGWCLSIVARITALLSTATSLLSLTM